MEGKHFYRVIASFLLLGCLVVWLPRIFALFAQQPRYGFTFSSRYAAELGLSVDEAYQAALSELQPTFVRLPVYWNDIERTSGQYDFAQLDSLIRMSHEANVPITLAVGFKVPRWPECFIPSWLNADDADAFRGALFTYLDAVVTRYKDNVTIWQVENEPLFPFGECPMPSAALLRDEVAFIRTLDADAVVQLTVSGEQMPWSALSEPADILGASLYRTVADEQDGMLTFPLTPRWYRFWSLVIASSAQPVISELQMEPWFVRDPRSYTIDEAVTLFSVADFWQHAAFAKQTGITSIGLWGVEWWYYLHIHGQDGLWEAAKELMVK